MKHELKLSENSRVAQVKTERFGIYAKQDYHRPILIEDLRPFYAGPVAAQESKVANCKSSTNHR